MLTKLADAYSATWPAGHVPAAAEGRVLQCKPCHWLFWPAATLFDYVSQCKLRLLPVLTRLAVLKGETVLLAHMHTYQRLLYGLLGLL